MKRCYRSKLNDANALLHQLPFKLSSPACRRARAVACADCFVAVTSRKNQLKEDARFRVLRLLQKNPDLSQREIADAVGVSVGTVHYILNALIDRGLVKIGNFSASDDKRRYAYILTPKGLAEKAAITGRFLSRKLEEYEALKREIEDLKVTMQPAQPQKRRSSDTRRGQE